MEARKQAILDALDAFVRQRSGLEFGNYGDVKSFRAEQRSITKDLHHYRELARYVQRHDSITADMLLEASKHAFSGRLELVAPHSDGKYDGYNLSDHWYVAYCTGQYFPTEYRRAACAVLASAIWDFWREQCMPAPREPRLIRWHGDIRAEHDNIDGKTPGDWLRANARREFHRGIASRWFD